MNICGIVAEYNPFHRGHRYHLMRTREKLGEDTLLVVCLSSYFVQRGEPALLSPHARAEMALSQGADLAQTIRDYYSSANEYDRAYQFIALTFGDVNTGDVSTFGDEIYQAATQDTGMQLLLYLNQMWVSDGWTIAEDSAVPLQGACRVFAQYLSGAVNGDRVKSDADTRMVTMAGDMLAEFLSAMGDGDAASAALSANDGSETSTTSSGSSVSEIFSGAAQGIQSGFSLQVFETVLLVIGAAALMLLLICIVMLVRRR